mmetsp:Transcript_17385/g.41651  ORF Transcript_17385/g.41651 Transcript_17385/m.41651 type:complete len:571 (-) Transcript_17385:1170-2882(-)
MSSMGQTNCLAISSRGPFAGLAGGAGCVIVGSLSWNPPEIGFSGESRSAASAADSSARPAASAEATRSSARRRSSSRIWSDDSDTPSLLSRSICRASASSLRASASARLSTSAIVSRLSSRAISSASFFFRRLSKDNERAFCTCFRRSSSSFSRRSASSSRARRCSSSSLRSRSCSALRAAASRALSSSFRRRSASSRLKLLLAVMPRIAACTRAAYWPMNSIRLISSSASTPWRRKTLVFPTAKSSSATPIVWSIAAAVSRSIDDASTSGARKEYTDTMWAGGRWSVYPARVVATACTMPEVVSWRLATDRSHAPGVLVSFGLMQRMKYSSPSCRVSMRDRSEVRKLSITPRNLPDLSLEPLAPPLAAAEAAASAAYRMTDETKADSEYCINTCRSCDTGSLFFSRKPVTVYTTSPAKWRTPKAVLEVLISWKAALLRCALHTFCRYVVSDPLGKTHSSDSIERSPAGIAPMSCTTPLLSLKAMGSTSIPSSWYCFATASKSTDVKSRCNFSLVKLMHSCSREFVLKISKPKMSTYAICGPSRPGCGAVAASAESDWLMWLTIHANMAE